MEKTETGLKYLALSLTAFAGIMMEFFYAKVLWPITIQVPPLKMTTFQNIAHWMLTALTWFAVAYILVRIAKKNWQFDLFERGGRMGAWHYATLLVCILICVGLKNLDGIKIVGELRYHGWFKLAFQMLYYFAEVALFTAIIVFGQKAGDLWFKKTNIPWGGIICALSWGLIHIASKDLVVGLLSALLGFLFGVAYLAVNRDIKKAYAALFIMFVF
jgi:hypothetical protein